MIFWPEGHFYSGLPLPTVVHYCQSFISGEFGFEKRAVPHDLFTCESPMLMDPPENLAKKLYMVKKKNMHKHDTEVDKVFINWLCYYSKLIHIVTITENKNERCNG